MPASSSGTCHPARRSRLAAAGMAALVFLGVAGAIPDERGAAEPWRGRP